jgi:hypothetical protein
MSKDLKIMMGALAAWTVILGFVFSFILHNQLTKAAEDKAAFEAKISQLSKQVAVAPKLVTLDLAQTAREWAGRSDQLAMKAVETTVNFYNEKGYIILDKASVIGKVGQYEGHVPSPEKMQQMLEQAKK